MAAAASEAHVEQPVPGMTCTTGAARQQRDERPCLRGSLRSRPGHMDDLATIAPAFVDMAHRTVWATMATVDASGRPRSRIVHPCWEWHGGELTGWVATGPTPAKRDHLAGHPHASVTYWAPTHDTCTAECEAAWLVDGDTRCRIWDLFTHAPAPVGYNPATIPLWSDGPYSPSFAVIRLRPWHLRVFPGSMLLAEKGRILAWRA